MTSPFEAIPRLNAALESRYRIERQLGEGGMATVYLARDLRHERHVALKVLKPELAAVVGADRFLAEIRTTANLQHPHILPLFDSGEADGFLFYVMPYVEGESLRERLDREHQLPVEEAVRIATDLAEALDHAHRQGVIHRDIKPANVLLVEGRPVLADFGIALAVSAGGGGRLTETGLSLGTPHYMSPEQATGDLSVGPATDVYALGCVLYEMLVGEPPYTGSTPQAVLGKIITGEVPSARAERRSVPTNVDAAIARALEKVPADRFRDAKEFARALGDSGFRTAASRATVTSAGTRHWRTAAAALALACLVMATRLIWLSSRPEPTASSVARFIVQPPEGASFGGSTIGGQIALSPDGEWLAFVGDDGMLYRRRLGQLQAEPVAGAQGASVPFFSPDSRWLGFHANRRLWKAPLSGGPPLPVAEAPPVSGVSWGDDDVIVFVRTTNGAAYTVPAAGGVPDQVPRADGSSGRYNQPWVLPGGGAALVTLRNNPTEVRVAALDLHTGDVDTLGIGTRVAFAGDHLVFSGADGTLFAQRFDPVERRTLGNFVPILQGVMLGHRGMGEFALSAGGGLAYLTGALASEELVIDGPDGRTVVPLSVEGDIQSPAFSPDGRRVAVQVRTVDNQDVWIFDRDQRTTDRLTVEGSVNMAPVWTPDAARIAIMSHRDDAPQGQIYWQATSGAGRAERLVDTEYAAIPYSWSPDGRTLAFVGIRADRNDDIGLLTVGESTPSWILASEFREIQPQISPDGGWLAYASDRSGELEVYVQPLAGGGSRTRVSEDGGQSPRWAPDGRTLYFIRGGEDAATLVAASVSTEGGFRVHSRVDLFDIEDTTTAGINYDVSPDGEEFAHVRFGAEGGRQLVWILNWPQIVGGVIGPR